MGAPLGIILNANPDQSAIDNYALVLNGVCQNVIVASYNQILPASVNYDYCIDIVIGRQVVGAGWNYNSVLNTFSNPNPPPPGPTNPQIAEDDFDDVITALQQLASDIQNFNINPSDLSTGYYNATNGDNPGLSQTFLSLMQSIRSWASEGGQ